jgi:hypothetical protein
MNDLEKHFEANEANRILKWKHYFDIYERHFSQFRGTQVNVVEFGVQHGGSARMWLDYFGAGATVYGIDIDPRCATVASEKINIIIGDQEDKGFLRTLVDTLPKIDVLIDDGGHTMKQQINTFEVMFPAIQSRGVYLCEDLHTSYWEKWGGGYKRDGTFIEYSKNFIDYINAWHVDEVAVSPFTKSANSLHFYDSVLVIEKQPRFKPTEVATGKKMFKAG